MFCLANNADGTAQLFEVQSPEDVFKCVCVSANGDNMWCVLENGHVYIRKRIHHRCRHGLEWHRINMLQLGEEESAHLFAY